ncbi:hypothetical protein V5799_018160 [Amblyomma americanum]|uniref:Uncharacterized protein n=1 Tax=Amblyomma americanum TaxID=6943 RepID=A0AAQ4F0J5_AMBAM
MESKLSEKSEIRQDHSEPRRSNPVFFQNNLRRVRRRAILWTLDLLPLKKALCLPVLTSHRIGTCQLLYHRHYRKMLLGN